MKIIDGLILRAADGGTVKVLDVVEIVADRLK
jgi:hypothetical protein